jgi:hypothetical protein
MCTRRTPLTVAAGKERTPSLLPAAKGCAAAPSVTALAVGCGVVRRAAGQNVGLGFLLYIPTLGLFVTISMGLSPSHSPTGHLNFVVIGTMCIHNS